MFEIIGVGAVGTLVGAGISYVLLKRENTKHINLFVLEGKAKANAIEFEAQKKLQDAHIKIKADELELEKKFQEKINELDKKSRILEEKRQTIETQSQKIQGIKRRAVEKEESLERLIEQQEQKIREIVEKMQHIASMTKEEAKAYILHQVEEQSKAEVAAIVRRYERLAKEEGERKANYIIAQATTRYAGDFAGERLINVVNLPSDEHKGRIIGKRDETLKVLRRY